VLILLNRRLAKFREEFVDLSLPRLTISGANLRTKFPGKLYGKKRGKTMARKKEVKTAIWGKHIY